jgi:hypothetical protein
MVSAMAGAAAINARVIPTKVGIHEHRRLVFNPPSPVSMDPETSSG